jgi:hypothetical protein
MVFDRMNSRCSSSTNKIAFKFVKTNLVNNVQIQHKNFERICTLLFKCNIIILGSKKVQVKSSAINCFEKVIILVQF